MIDSQELWTYTLFLNVVTTTTAAATTTTTRNNLDVHGRLPVIRSMFFFRSFASLRELRTAIVQVVWSLSNTGSVMVTFLGECPFPPLVQIRGYAFQVVGGNFWARYRSAQDVDAYPLPSHGSLRAADSGTVGGIPECRVSH